jgi:hypothetical protein
VRREPSRLLRLPPGPSNLTLPVTIMITIRRQSYGGGGGIGTRSRLDTGGAATPSQSLSGTSTPKITIYG